MTPHTLFPYQQRALDQSIGHPRIALFMEMRLGKTPVAIRWAESWRDDLGQARILLVAPLSVLDDWHDELKREGIRRIIRLDGVSQSLREELAYGGATAWYLVNYEAVRLNAAMADMPWDVIILDESTAIRNPQAKITKRLTNDYAHVPHRAILTGEPAPESELDYFEQMRFVYGSFLSVGSYWAFRNRYFKQDPHVGWLWYPRPGVRDTIKQAIHQQAVVMTRQQEGIGGTKTYRRRVVPLNPAQRDALKQLKKFSYEYVETNFATVRDVWMARVAGGFSPDRENPEQLSDAKQQELLTLLRGELKGQPVVVWFRFNEELQSTVLFLRRHGILTDWATGETPVKNRHRLRVDFNEGKFRVICIQVALGKFGWNLSRATTAIYYSNAYDRQSRGQSEDRIVHPTKKEPLLYIDLVTQGTLDEEVVRSLRMKRMSSRAMLRRLNATVWQTFWEGKGENQKAQTTRYRAARLYPGTRP